MIELNAIEDWDRTGAFALEIDFRPNTFGPARVFRAMTDLVEACQEIDLTLAEALGVGYRPTTLLGDIEAGSLRALLLTALENVDDDSLKSLDYKKFFGSFLVKGKRVLVKYLQGKHTIRSADEIRDVQRELSETARHLQIVPVDGIIIPGRQVAESIRMLSEATEPLKAGAGDRALFLSEEPPVEFNLSFHVTKEAIAALLTNEKITTQREMILQVKRPDFLGSARWEFRHGPKRIDAKVTDEKWLNEFYGGAAQLRPGCALRALVEETTAYGFEGDVIDTEYQILRVHDVIARDQVRRT